MPISDRFFEALFGFPEADYVTTRRGLLQRCTFEVVRANVARGHSRVLKERALFHHPRVAGGHFISSGWHSTPSVAELRAETVETVRAFEQKNPGLLAKVAASRRPPCTPSSPASPVTCAHVTGDAGQMHRSITDGFFQVASQFNLLEFASCEVTPEHGVRHYVYDRTQGPACALACMGGTVYRNYLLHPHLFGATGVAPATEGADEASRGQRVDRQVNVLNDLVEYLIRARGSGDAALDPAVGATDSVEGSVPALPREHFFKIHNGYFVQTRQIASLTARCRCIAAAEGISAADVEEELLSRLRIGLVEDATVTLPLHDSPFYRAHAPREPSHQAEREVVATPGTAVAPGVTVHVATQTYNSALSLPSQDKCTSLEWNGIAALARIILRGTYEATLLAGVQHTIRHLERQASLAGASPPAARLFSLPPILLTKVGGGVFGNDKEWIASSIASAVHRVAALGVPLDVRLVHFQKVEEYYLDSLPSWPVLD
ncbi:hypothetical protein JIQ42_03023 [Leishmania sp. Namibia]|uniref:hypothetical protein n=1 Tax=Leishmania sp. Namibia TaxID=2802991 RepID=UPI001B6F435B|nr:hypothetical protein JIQ42_03023 [Leishmania sp. Namibia]